VGQVYDSLDNKSLEAMDRVAAGTMVMCCAMYIAMGIAGYLLLGAMPPEMRAHQLGPP
jgi:amino acid permease